MLRNFAYQGNKINSSDFSGLHSSLTNLTLFKLLTVNKKISFLEQEICSLTRGESYELFFPQNSQLTYQIFNNHSLCTKSSFIEEGVGSYNFKLLTNGNQLTQYKKYMAKILNMLNLSPSISFNNGFYENRKGNDFYIVDSIFSKYIASIVTRFDYKFMSYKGFTSKLESSEPFLLLVLSPYVYMKLMDEKQYSIYLNNLIFELTCKYKMNIAIKLHPTQNCKQLDINLSNIQNVTLVDNIDDFTTLPLSSVIYGDCSSMMFYLKLSNPDALFIPADNGLNLSMEKDMFTFIFGDVKC
jgi:hypothetical protein